MRFNPNKVRNCECGCGQPTLLYFDGDRFKGYARGIPGHLRKQSNDKWRDFRRRELDKARFQHEKILGTRRLHEVRPGFFYYLIKIAAKGKWPYEHRVIAAQQLGRPLTANEHVHHINENTLDNRPDNLKIVTASTHRAEHRIKRWSRHFDACRMCGLDIRKHLSLGLCTRCYQRPH